MNLLEPPPDDRRPAQIRGATYAIWVVLIWDLLTQPVKASVRLPAGTPPWVLADAGYALLLVFLTAKFAITYAVTRGISEARGWARLVVTILFVLSIVAHVPWIVVHADRTTTMLVRLTSIFLKAYVVVCLFSGVGRAWFAPMTAPSRP